jgi:hypothetical protein
LKKKIFTLVSFVFIIFAFALTATACSSNETDIFKKAVFQSQNFVYDGNEHSIFVTGVPDGTKITYADNSAVKVGEYRAFAYLEKDGRSKIMTAIFGINRASMEGITFEDAAVTYDGNPKDIAVSGNVPEDAEVTYTMNNRPFTGVTDAGTYTVTANLSSDSYNPLTLTAVLTINKAEIKGVSFPNKNFVYDGEVKTAAVSGTLPAGTNVTYTNVDGSAFTGHTLPGTYKVNAAVSGANYNTLTLPAELFIDKATITGVTFADYSTVYDGTPHSIKINGTLPQGVSVKYTLGSENGTVFENAVKKGVYEVFAALTGNYYKKLTLTAALIITADRLTAVTGISLDRTVEDGGKNNGMYGVTLSWDPVPNAASYDVYISYTDGTSAMQFNVAGTSCDIKDKVFTTLYRDKYNVQIMAMPASRDENYAPSVLSAAVSYDHKGRLPAPKNVRIENDRLTWDAVIDADMYEIRICLLDADGAVVKGWQGGRTISTSESVKDVVDDYKSYDKIPAGTYCFQIRASTANNSYWVGVYASDYSSYSADTVVVS